MMSFERENEKKDTVININVFNKINSRKENYGASFLASYLLQLFR